MSDEIQLPSAEKVEREIEKVQSRLTASKIDVDRWTKKLGRLRALLAIVQDYDA